MEERGTDLKLFAWKETSHSRDTAFERVECEPRSGELAKRIASLPWRKGSDSATGSQQYAMERLVGRLLWSAMRGVETGWTVVAVTTGAVVAGDGCRG